jgi:ABC-2 type transport system permease protein
MLSFVSGIFIPLDTLPNFLQDVGRVFPLYHLAQGLQSTVAQNPSGIGLSASDAAALVIWGLAAIWVATRRFKWEPQGRAAEAA